MWLRINLVFAQKIPSVAFGESRVVILPSVKLTISDLLVGLGELARYENGLQKGRHEEVIKAAYPWPVLFDTTLAENLGFSQDHQINELIRKYSF